MNANDFNKNTQSNILNHREFNIKNENNIYNLRIEIDQDYIYFILSKINENLEYIYKNKMDLSSMLEKLELPPSKFSNLELILKKFDIIYQKNKIDINICDDNSINILIKLLDIFEEETIKEIKVYKNYTNNNDKFNILFNQLKMIKNINNNNIIENKIEIQNN